MHRLITLIAFLATVAFAAPVAAQQNTFVQIEARQGLRDAQTQARAWSTLFTDVVGLRMDSGWYAVALGPYSETDAQNRMRALQSENLIPSDAFLAYSGQFSQQFWPVGGVALLNAPAPQTPSTSAPTPPSTPQTEVASTETSPAPAPEETVREARRSEAALSRSERETLQVALKWEGFYNSAIDGAFGRGTRAAMSAWQESRALEPTGVLTTRQRTQLLDDYNAVLASIGMESYTHPVAGIRLDLPLALIAESTVAPPFIHFDAAGDDDIRVLLISQSGTAATLGGLYEIMQTLEIVPPEGARAKQPTQFELTGQNADFISTTWAQYENGAVKGFTLIWPNGDERRRSRVYTAMRESFAALPDAVLPDAAGDPGEDQSIDLLAGLELRQPELSRSGFFINTNGTIVTSAEINGQCREITLDHDHNAEVIFSDADLGISVLRPVQTLAPRAHVGFRTGAARIRSDIVIAGFPFEGVLEHPTLTFGRLEDVRDLSGNNKQQRLSLLAEPGDNGGPVFDTSGNVIGVLLPAPTPEGQQLPEIVRFSTRSHALIDRLTTQGLTMNTSENTTNMAPEDLTRHAADVTVLVSCWN